MDEVPGNERETRRDFMRRMGCAIGAGAMAPIALSCLRTARAVDAQSRPNIIFIMSDDHATRAVSAYGAGINQTPNIDRIGREGVIFRNCFCVNSLCVPSRSSILTGLYSHKSGVRFHWDELAPELDTFPELLQAAGYQTALVGKWHVSRDYDANPPQGFDYWCALPGQGKYYDPVMYENGERKTIPGYTTDIITDKALRFLEQRDPRKPFLLLCHHKAPHDQWEYDKRYKDLFADGDIPLPGNFADDHASQIEAVRRKGRTIGRLRELMEAEDWPTGPLDTSGMSPEEANLAAYQKFAKDYLRCVASIDASVGRLLDWLDANGLTRDTLVVYTSDQGEFLGAHGWYDKRMMYEESLRMPLLARYPREIAPGSAVDAMALNIDFAETLLEIAGEPVPGNMQGRSLRPLFSGQNVDWRSSFFYSWHHHDQEPKHYGVRAETQKLIYYPNSDEWEFYDLEEDPLELVNRYGDPARAQDIQRLKDELARLIRELEIPEEDLRPNGIEKMMNYRQNADRPRIRPEFF